MGEKDRNVAPLRTDRGVVHRQIIEEWKVVTTADAKVDGGGGRRMTCVCPRATDIESSGASLLSRSEKKNNSPRRFILHSRKRRGRHSTIREKCADKAAGAAECGLGGATGSHFTHGSLKSKEQEGGLRG